MAIGDASEFYKLAADLSHVGITSALAMRGVIQTGANALKQGWQANARETAGAHGVHYPDSITYETRILATSVIGDVGPDKTKPQGGMSFEFGSRNQPPHLDGLRALDGMQAPLEKAIEVAIGNLLE